MAAVAVESLTIAYGSVVAVDDLSFEAEAGEVTCVLGPNGAGKTSTVEALEGLRLTTSGRLSVIGLDPRTDHRALTERMGVMLQEGGIHPAVRVREALRHAAALYRSPLDPPVLLERLGLAGLEGRSYRQLSGGEQRRLALALALVGRPQVAFLDEPTTGVDPAGRQVIRQVVADLRAEGVTVLLTTHDLDEAERVADRVVIVVGGRLVAAGTVEELTKASGADAEVRFRAPAGLDVESLARHLGDVAVREVAPGDYVVATAPTPQAVASVTAWLAAHELPLADLRAGRQRLEDVYLRLTATAPDSPTPPTTVPPTSTPAPGPSPESDTPSPTAEAGDADAGADTSGSDGGDDGDGGDTHDDDADATSTGDPSGGTGADTTPNIDIDIDADSDADAPDPSTTPDTRPGDATTPTPPAGSDPAGRATAEVGTSVPDDAPGIDTAEPDGRPSAPRGADVTDPAAAAGGDEPEPRGGGAA